MDYHGKPKDPHYLTPTSSQQCILLWIGASFKSTGIMSVATRMVKSMLGWISRQINWPKHPSPNQHQDQCSTGFHIVHGCVMSVPTAWVIKQLNQMIWTHLSSPESNTGRVNIIWQMAGGTKLVGIHWSMPTRSHPQQNNGGQPSFLQAISNMARICNDGSFIQYRMPLLLSINWGQDTHYPMFDQRGSGGSVMGQVTDRFKRVASYQ